VQVKVLEEHISKAGILGLYLLLTGDSFTKLMLARTYLEMEKIFKVYVYPDCEPPIVHDGLCKAIHSIEGRILYEMEHGAGWLPLTFTSCHSA